MSKSNEAHPRFCQLPATYIALQHPVRYAVISSDARLIAVAGRRGLTHYNALSGRWKLFEVEKEEESLRVVGGMAWWSNVLIVACIEGGVYQVSISLDRFAFKLTKAHGISSASSRATNLSPSPTRSKSSLSALSPFSSPSSIPLFSSTPPTTPSTTFSFTKPALEPRGYAHAAASASKAS